MNGICTVMISSKCFCPRYTTSWCKFYNEKIIISCTKRINSSCYNISSITCLLNRMRIIRITSTKCFCPRYTSSWCKFYNEKIIISCTKTPGISRYNISTIICLLNRMRIISITSTKCFCPRYTTSWCKFYNEKIIISSTKRLGLSRYNISSITCLLNRSYIIKITSTKCFCPRYTTSWCKFYNEKIIISSTKRLGLSRYNISNIICLLNRSSRSCPIITTSTKCFCPGYTSIWW